MSDDPLRPVTEPDAPPEAEDGAGRPRRSRRGLIWLLILAAVLLLGALTAIPALGAKARLEDARADLQSGRALLIEGDLVGAEAAFQEAERGFAAGLDKVRHPLIRLISYLPVVGRTPDAVELLADAGARVSRAARLTTAAVNDLPGGLGDLAPKDGALPVDLLARMAPALERAGGLVDSAVALLERTEDRLLFGPVAAAREEFALELPQAQHTIEAGAAMARSLPAFLGAEGTRRYFFGAQNPAELRGTGGFIGAYSILVVKDGRLRFGPFLPIQELADRTGQSAPPPPNPSFQERYERFGGSGIWENINMTPDFPSAAEAIETLYEDVEGVRLDGTIVVDPFAYSALLGITGPVDVPSAGRAIDSGNAVAFLSNEAYTLFTSDIERKLVLGEAAKTVFERFLQEGAAANPVGAARTLLQAAADGHILLHARDEAQEAFETAGIAGELLNPPGDYLGVYVNNAAANKVDYYMDTLIRYDVTLKPDGSATASTSVTLTNAAPTEGVDSYVIGPWDRRFVAGENRGYVSTYYSSSSRLESFRAPGELTEVIGSQEELGHPVFSTFIRTKSGEDSNLLFETTLPEAWRGTGANGRYRLTYEGQRTIRPTQLEVAIHLPEGTSVVNSSPELAVEENRAVWRGDPGDELQLEVSFRGSEGGGALTIGIAVAALLLLAGGVAMWLLRRRGRHLDS